MSPIIFSENFENELKELLSLNKNSKILVITDENLYPLIIDSFNEEKVDFFKMQAGEEFKNLTTCEKVWGFLANKQYRRNDLIINIGGGVVTDLGGFIAATFKRGMRFVNFPTSLLAMVDASIGGKTGVDFNGFKNQIGSFYFPECTIIAANFLKTLPRTELISGFAEVLKHGLINDRIYWDLCTSKDILELDWKEVLNGSVKIKSDIVEEDPMENGKRKLLNFGHTAGHAIETYSLNNENKVLHGNAVAAGMIIESYISMQAGLLPTSDYSSIEDIIHTIFPKISWKEGQEKELIELMRNDKKNTSNQINFTLLEGIGKGIFNQIVAEEEIVKALNYYNNLI